MYFEDMGITYIGPIDGHNVPLMVDTLNRAKQLDEPNHYSRGNEERKRISSCGAESSQNFTESVHFP